MPGSKKVVVSNAQISDLLAPFGVHLSADQDIKVREYIHILMKWNKLINLTSIVDPMEIVARHFGESMYLASLLPVENGRLADVGTGAGFPGLALKILCGDLQTILIESNKKKCAFLLEVVTALELRGVEILSLRFEDVRSETGFYNFVTARAVGNFQALLRWSHKSLSDRGHLILWVGLEDATRISTTPGWAWHPAVRIPDSKRRFILIGKPLPSSQQGR